VTEGPDLERVLADNTADLHRYLLRRLSDPEDAAEALNDVLLTAWRHPGRVPPDPQEARLWLYGVAANVQRNHHRARNRRSALVRRLLADPTARTPGGEPDAAQAAVRDAIGALPGELAELVRLHHWEGFSLAEAATILGVPASTARTRYAAARRRLRAALSPADDEEPASVPCRGSSAPGAEDPRQSRSAGQPELATPPSRR